VGQSDAAAADAASTLRRLVDRRPVHGLVHSAALQLTGTVEQLSVSDFNRTLAVNVVAPYALTRELATDLRESCGSVVLVTSIHSRLTKSGFALYATSKAALSGLMRSLALELAPVVRVNAVSPAATDTAMLRAGFGTSWGETARQKLDAVHPLMRIARPEEVADAIAYLLSSRASFITATELEVGGGIHACLHDPA
jgi:NAD(P)-dependent dehydrogenase (short-subunit alcohol dehydrogenase family)